MSITSMTKTPREFYSLIEAYFHSKLHWTYKKVVYGEYYMAVRIYEITHRVFDIFQHEKRNFLFPSGHIIFYLSYKQQWNPKPFHFPREKGYLLCKHSSGERANDNNETFAICLQLSLQKSENFFYLLGKIFLFLSDLVKE